MKHFIKRKTVVDEGHITLLEHSAANTVQTAFRELKASKGKKNAWTMLRSTNIRQGTTLLTIVNIKWKYIRLVDYLDPNLVQFMPLINPILGLEIPGRVYILDG